MLMVQNVCCACLLFRVMRGDNGRGVKKDGKSEKSGLEVMYRMQSNEVRWKGMCCVVGAIEQVSCSVFVGEVNEKEKKKGSEGKEATLYILQRGGR